MTFSLLKLIFGHIFLFLYFANLFKHKKLKKAVPLKGGRESFSIGKNLGGGS